MARAREVAVRRAIPCSSAVRHRARHTRGSANRCCQITGVASRRPCVQKREGRADKTAGNSKAICWRFSSPRLTWTASYTTKIQQYDQQPPPDG